MLVVGFPAGPFETNCWVVAPDRGEQCVVIDPGVNAEEHLEDVLTEHKLAPVAVLITHGHLDHTWAVAPVCGAKDIPALIHPADRPMCTDPTMGLGVPPGTPIFGRLESWICMGCGYVEFYAHGYSPEGFEELAEQFPDQFRVVDAEPKGQGPFR